MRVSFLVVAWQYRLASPVDDSSIFLRLVMQLVPVQVFHQLALTLKIRFTSNLQVGL